MRHLLFKVRPDRQGLGTHAPGMRARVNSGHGSFVAADAFAGMLALERKRVERSRRWLLLMLLDVHRLFETSAGQKLVSRIESALTASTRETDVTGWYRFGSVIGVIFTETGGEAKSAVSTAVLARITQVLENKLASEAAKKISISLSFFPEERDTEHPGDAINGQLYPDLLREPGGQRIARLLKRAIDVVISLLVLIFFSPLFAALACLIKLTSRGPVLFRQKRVGQRGRHFEFLKFRSMYVQNNAGIHRDYVRKFIAGGSGVQAAGGNNGSVYKITRDARVTPVGRFLRKSSLDELPQFWNVLKGEMSLVGPRPPIPYEFEMYALWHRRRVLEAKPGITGLWQVNGRSRTTFDEMVRLDLEYVRQWSLWLDLKILLRTTEAVLSCQGAY
jgi:exopolysaccharide biosynthesis polyprenyl glycosylphosphotransferase